MKKIKVIFMMLFFISAFLFASSSPDKTYTPPGVTRNTLENKNPLIQMYYQKEYIQPTLTEYIKGVVAAEIGSKWSETGNPDNFVTIAECTKINKAQAIASKGFALQLLKIRGKGGYLSASTDDQDYGNFENSTLPLDVKNAVATAVNDTKNKYLTVFHRRQGYNENDKPEVIFSKFASGWSGYATDVKKHRIDNYSGPQN